MTLIKYPAASTVYCVFDILTPKIFKVDQILEKFFCCFFVGFILAFAQFTVP